MDGAGFHVELDVLEEAARRMQDIVADQDGRELREVCGGAQQYGHEGVHAELAEFCNAWSVGVDAVCDRARTMGAELREVAQAYREIDQEAARTLNHDPGVEATEPSTPDVAGH
jgi:hypothetical protein